MKLGIHGQTTHRQYDSVAESLYRIQNKINIHSKNRNKNIQKQVSKLSRNNSEANLKNEKWNDQCKQDIESNLLRNCNKALLMEKKMKQKDKINKQKATHFVEDNREKLDRFMKGNKDVN